MLDFSQVLDFQRRLHSAADTSKVEKEWKQDTARDLAKSINPPRHTGALAASVRATDDGVSMLDYWQYPEYGTVNMAPRPFVRPAVNRQLPKAAAEAGRRAVDDLT
jgi:HK97 gp10 family phage protein